jgi:hypothetical protein
MKQFFVFSEVEESYGYPALPHVIFRPKVCASGAEHGGALGIE